MGVVVRRYIVDILTIIINFPYSTCIRVFFCISIPTSLFILKMFFRSFNNYNGVLAHKIYIIIVIIYNLNYLHTSSLMNS